MRFIDAVKNTPVEARTWNGMKALKSSLSATTDLFYGIGASRGKDITPDFERAWQEQPEVALRIALYARDARGGAGERQTFRNILLYMEREHSDVFFDTNILERIPDLGRWDDLLIFQTERVKHRAFDVIRKALEDGNGLCAKWMPRQKAIAVEMRNYFGWSPKYYRKRLVELTKVVESQMCAKQWDEINFSHVPSVAMSRYTKAFAKNAPEHFQAYKDALVKGTDPKVKVNASAVFPYDVIKGLRHGGPDSTVANKQWEALPNYLKDGSRALPMVDVSGSMTMYDVNGAHVGYGGRAGQHAATLLDVAVSLGLYLSERNVGPFKDLFLTFSGSPTFEHLTGTLSQRMTQMERSHWAMNTNLHAAMAEILRVATENKVPQEEMPDTLLILSDMQFDQCVTNDDSAMQMIARKFDAAGYKVPAIVFWNLNGKTGNVPVTHSTQGVALVSGFSPSIMATILGADPEEFTPSTMMLKAVMVDRYALEVNEAA